MISDFDIASFRAVIGVVNVMFQCPDVHFLGDVDIVSDDEFASAAVKNRSAADDCVVSDGDVLRFSDVDLHEERWLRSYMLEEWSVQEGSDCIEGNDRDDAQPYIEAS